MSRKKKTPAFLVELIERCRGQIEWIEEMLDTKTRVPVENQADHVRTNTVEHFMGRMIAINATLEDALHAYGCYRGFMYTARPVTVDGKPVREFIGLADPRFHEQRRQYLIG
jgi:hypothetical protein